MRIQQSWLIVVVLAIAGSVQCAGQGADSGRDGPQAVRNGSAETAPTNQEWILYRNEQYGFCFSIPASWQGYSIVKQDWSGNPGGSGSDQRGPKLLIRHPKWTAAQPYEDIPILIFSKAQWKLIEREELMVSAAPFPPSELARNARYVFALPPRYNYDLARGYEEVEELVRGRHLKAPCDDGASLPK